MPRNTLKSFPTGMLRRGLAHFHPASIAVVQPPIDSPPEPPGNTRAVPDVTPQATGPSSPAPARHPAVPEASGTAKTPHATEAVTPQPVA